MNPKISIVIPVYNVEKYLRECLDSVCAQTFTDWECICVDDGSTDSSPAILDEYAAKDKRFKIIKREHSNAGACRNAGLDISKGEYLSFLDSDDIFAPKMLEILYTCITENDADIASCGYANWSDGESLPKLDGSCAKTQIQTYDSPAANVDIFTLWGGMAWDKLFRKSLIDKSNLRYQEIRWTNDFRFVMLAVTFAKRIVKCQARLLAYRQGHISLQSTRAKKALCFYDAIGSYREIAQQMRLLSEGSFLEQNFKHFFVKFTFHHMDTIETPTAYEEVHTKCQELCKEWGVSDLSENDFKDWEQDAFSRFKKIRQGCSPLESSRLHEIMLMKEVAELRPLKYMADYRNSIDYKIGRILLCFPRALKRLVRKTLNLFA